MERIEECIRQLEFIEQSTLSENEKRVFKIAYIMGLKDGEKQYKKEIMAFLDL